MYLYVCVCGKTTLTGRHIELILFSDVRTFLGASLNLSLSLWSEGERGERILIRSPCLFVVVDVYFAYFGPLTREQNRTKTGRK